MTWELASFVVLAAVLLSGFAWYERSRPPSQVVALVAALAALAIAGRIAFAAFPNVKPTTDIVIFAGYALGPAPGFAVGALTGLVSNLWFGQGPWTPWQMAGWGMCGVVGAALAVGGRSVGRLTLAAVCGLAGIAYGVLLNFSLMATYGGDLSLERFLLLQSRAVPFDAAHAVGNVVFALIAGPAMVRMLVRFRQRFEWRTPALATTTLLALLLLVSLPSSASAANVDRAASWLISQQNDDGGFGASLDDASSVSTTAWTALGLAAADHNPLDVSRQDRTPIDFLRANVEELTSPGDFARTILALDSAGVDPRSFGGRNLVEALLKRRRADGSYVGWPGTTAFAVIALKTAGVKKGLDRSLAWLGKAQNGDGGWGDLAAPPSTADGTAAVMQAMPESDLALQGLAYLRKHQRQGGGFVTASTGAVNSQSTAWAVQGMVAVGADPDSIEAGGKSALDYLAERQAPDGHYRYSASKDDTPVWVTAQVLAAVARQPYPVSRPPRAPEPSDPETDGSAPAPGSISPPEESPALPPADGGVTAPPAGPGSAGQPPLGSPSVPPAAGVPETEGLPETETAEPAPKPVTATGDDGPAPWTPVGIGLATGGLALGLPWWLGRRNGW